MRKISLLAVLLLTLLLIGTSAPVVHADENDEAAIEQVSLAVDDLFALIEESADTPDAEFYPLFDEAANHTQSQLQTAAETLAETTETGATALAVEQIQGSVQEMQQRLGVWRSVALEQNAAAFEDAGQEFNASADAFNTGVEAYELHEYRAPAIQLTALYVGAVVLAFALMSWLFAWAVYKNTSHETDVAAEALRRQRWQLAYFAAMPFIASLLPAYVFFIAEQTPPMWLWLIVLASLSPLVYACWRYIKILRLSKAHKL